MTTSSVGDIGARLTLTDSNRLGLSIDSNGYQTELTRAGGKALLQVVIDLPCGLATDVLDATLRHLVAPVTVERQLLVQQHVGAPLVVRIADWHIRQLEVQVRMLARLVLDPAQFCTSQTVSIYQRSTDKRTQTQQYK